MKEQQQVDFTSATLGGYHAYRLFSRYYKESVALTPEGLLEVAAWSEANRTKLKQEAQENQEQETSACGPRWATLEAVRRLVATY